MHLPHSSNPSFGFQMLPSLTMFVKREWKMADPHLITSCQLVRQHLFIWQQLVFWPRVPRISLNLFLWFPDVTITHNVHEQKIENGQPAPDKVLLTLQPGLIHMAATVCIVSKRMLQPLTMSLKKRWKNGQPQSDNVLSVAPPGLFNMARAGIPSMSTNDLYSTVTHNIHEEKVENDQPQPNNVLSTLQPVVINWAVADATITHNVFEERMENNQLPSNNILSTVLPGLTYLATADIPAMSIRDQCMFASKLYCPTWFSYACIVSPMGEDCFVILSFVRSIECSQITTWHILSGFMK
ncbi:Sarcoma antigen 1 [Plecturocebus cupreus]